MKSSTAIVHRAHPGRSRRRRSAPSRPASSAPFSSNRRCRCRAAKPSPLWRSFSPARRSAAHTHPGEEIGYILEGTIVLEQDGKPAVTLGAGKTFFIPAGTVHNATNKTSSPARVLANYIVEPGKPVATPVAAK